MRSISTKRTSRCSSSSLRVSGRFPTYAEFLAVLRRGRIARQRAALSRAAAAAARCDARAYWDKRNLIGRPRHAYFTDGFYRHGMLGRFIGLAHLVAKLARIDPAALLNGDVEFAERVEALDALGPPVSFAVGAPFDENAGPAVQPRYSAAAAGAPGGGRTAQRGAARAVAAPDQRSPQRHQLFRLAGAASRLFRPWRPLSATLSAAQPVRANAQRCGPDHPGARQSRGSFWKACRRARSMPSFCSIRRTGWRLTKSARSGTPSTAPAATACGSIFRTAGVQSPVERPELAPLRQIWRSRRGAQRDRFRAGSLRDLWRVPLLSAALIHGISFCDAMPVDAAAQIFRTICRSAAPSKDRRARHVSARLGVARGLYTPGVEAWISS